MVTYEMEYWNNLTEIDWVLWIAGLYALFEFFKWTWSAVEWLISKFGIETKGMKSKREVRDRLIKAENDITDIRETSTQNVNTFLEHERLMSESFVDVKKEIVQEIGKLNDKIDKQHTHLEEIDRDGKRRDCSLMRDRLLSGLRYFSQNRDEHNNVHISMTDFENMSKMFEEYEKAGGNGLVKHLKETEFDNFIVDTEKRF